MTKDLTKTTNEEDIIKNVYYFGSSKDGFNVSPLITLEDVGQRVFDHYYTNCAPEDWIINLRKVNSNVFHTFVQYGLITSFDDGREGSHLGVSIQTKNNYFDNMKSLHEIFEEIKDLLIKEERLIKKNKYGTIGFIPYRLSSEEDYLKRFITYRIKSLFREEYLKKEFREIPKNTPDGERCYKIHLKSNPESFYEFFKKTGSIWVADHKNYHVF